MRHSICDVRCVLDMNDGERAFPEDGRSYERALLGSSRHAQVRVKYLERRGINVVACCVDGSEPVVGSLSPAVIWHAIVPVILDRPTQQKPANRGPIGFLPTEVRRV